MSIRSDANEDTEAEQSEERTCAPADLQAVLSELWIEGDRVWFVAAFWNCTGTVFWCVLWEGRTIAPPISQAIEGCTDSCNLTNSYGMIVLYINNVCRLDLTLGHSWGLNRNLCGVRWHCFTTTTSQDTGDDRCSRRDAHSGSPVPCSAAMAISPCDGSILLGHTCTEEDHKVVRFNM